MTEWKEGYLAALEGVSACVAARGLWSVALDELIEDLRQDAIEIEYPAGAAGGWASVVRVP